MKNPAKPGPVGLRVSRNRHLRYSSSPLGRHNCTISLDK